MAVVKEYQAGPARILVNDDNYRDKPFEQQLKELEDGLNRNVIHAVWPECRAKITVNKDQAGGTA